jgi:DNA-binding Lrp family transcriptional regulator
VAAALAAIDGVTSVAALNGPYDLVVLVSAADVDRLGRIIAERIQRLRHVARTLTCPVVRG